MLVTRKTYLPGSRRSVRPSPTRSLPASALIRSQSAFRAGANPVVDAAFRLDELAAGLRQRDDGGVVLGLGGGSRRAEAGGEGEGREKAASGGHDGSWSLSRIVAGAGSRPVARPRAPEGGGGPKHQDRDAIKPVHNALRRSRATVSGAGQTRSPCRSPVAIVLHRPWGEHDGPRPDRRGPARRRRPFWTFRWRSISTASRRTSPFSASPTASPTGPMKWRTTRAARPDAIRQRSPHGRLHPRPLRLGSRRSPARRPARPGGRLRATSPPT